MQGVGFRFSVRERAAALGITGYVLNLPDGSVEVTAEGNARQLQELEEFLHRGPRFSQVERVHHTERELAARQYHTFCIKR